MFADNLRRIRKERNITQLQLATMLGFSSGTVAMWETGARTPRYPSLKKICDLFSVTLDELCGRTSESCDRVNALETVTFFVKVKINDATSVSVDVNDTNFYVECPYCGNSENIDIVSIFNGQYNTDIVCRRCKQVIRKKQAEKRECDFYKKD